MPGKHRAAVRSPRRWLITAMVVGLVAALVGPVGADDHVTNGEYPLYAGQDMEVGTVYVTNGENTIFVEYSLTGDWCMTESHVEVFADADNFTDVPHKNGNPIPGQFESNMDHDCVTNYTHEIGFDGPGEYYIAAHAEVKAPISGEYETVFMIGQEETLSCTDGQLVDEGTGTTLTNYADEFNWGEPAGPCTAGPNLGQDAPSFADPFIVGTTPTHEFPFNSNASFGSGYATDFDVQFMGDLHFGGELRVSWSPGQSASEVKVAMIGSDSATWTRQGTAISGQGFFLDTFPVYKDSLSVSPLGYGTHTINFTHTQGDGTFWDWVRLVKPAEQEESAWAATGVGHEPFPGRNWATYVPYDSSPVASVKGTNVEMTTGPADITLTVLAYKWSDGTVTGEFLYRFIQGGTETVVSSDGTPTDLLVFEDAGVTYANVCGDIAAGNATEFGLAIMDEDQQRMRQNPTAIDCTTPYSGPSFPAVEVNGEFTITP